MLVLLLPSNLELLFSVSLDIVIDSLFFTSLFGSTKYWYVDFLAFDDFVFLGGSTFKETSTLGTLNAVLFIRVVSWKSIL